MNRGAYYLLTFKGSSTLDTIEFGLGARAVEIGVVIGAASTKWRLTLKIVARMATAVPYAGKV
jgi:hypothetical protein